MSESSQPFKSYSFPAHDGDMFGFGVYVLAHLLGGVTYGCSFFDRTPMISYTVVEKYSRGIQLRNTV